MLGKSLLVLMGMETFVEKQNQVTECDVVDVARLK